MVAQGEPTHRTLGAARRANPAHPARMRPRRPRFAVAAVGACPEGRGDRRPLSSANFCSSGVPDGRTPAV